MCRLVHRICCFQVKKNVFDNTYQNKKLTRYKGYSVFFLPPSPQLSSFSAQMLLLYPTAYIPISLRYSLYTCRLIETHTMAYTTYSVLRFAFALKIFWCLFQISKLYNYFFIFIFLKAG